MPAKQHTMHGRDHLPGGADPIGALAAIQAPPWIAVVQTALQATGTNQLVDWAGGGGVSTQDGSIYSWDSGFNPDVYSSDWYAVDWVAHTTRIFTILQTGIYLYNFCAQYSGPAVTSNPYTIGIIAIEFASGGFVTTGLGESRYHLFDQTKLAFSTSPTVQHDEVIVVSSAPVYWSASVQHNAGAPPFAGDNEMTTTASLVRLGDFA